MGPLHIILSTPYSVDRSEKVVLSPSFIYTLLGYASALQSFYKIASMYYKNRKPDSTLVLANSTLGIGLERTLSPLGIKSLQYCWGPFCYIPATPSEISTGLIRASNVSEAIDGTTSLTLILRPWRHGCLRRCGPVPSGQHYHVDDSGLHDLRLAGLLQIDPQVMGNRRLDYDNSTCSYDRRNFSWLG